MSKPPAQSPFAPKRTPRLPKLEGVRIATAEAGIHYRDREDLMLAVFDPGTTVAGSLTRSKTASAPVAWCRKALKAGSARALVVNSGNANAFTGQRGEEAVKITAAAAAEAASCAPRDVFLASTGVIGEPLDTDTFAHLLSDMAQEAKPGQFDAAAKAIMTTDTYPKLVTIKTDIAGTPVTINGIVKGAGMIAPDMATMLCFLFTDAALSGDVLQTLIDEHVQTTFNCMTIDGDTSTSDTCLIFATGKAADRGQKHVTSAASKNSGPFLRPFTRSCKAWPFKSPRMGKG